jgi:hypothetical protein
MRLARTILILILSAVCLSSCILLGEAPTYAELYNPTTYDRVSCDFGMHRYPGNKELKERDKCVSDYEAKGYVLEDSYPPITNPASDRHS